MKKLDNVELSPSQREILDSDAPYQFVQSSAAGGKTRLICEKILKAVRANKRTVAFTFTNMAAEEMRQRLGLKNNDRLYIGTIHSYCAKILLERGVQEAKKVINTEKFDELFNLARKHITGHPPVIDICICDEAQDSNLQQLQFIFDILQAPEYFVVYDIRQSIYRWAGARPQLLLEYGDRIGATYFEMKENYRNKEEILDFARTRLGPGSPPDMSVAMRGPGGKVETYMFSEEEIVLFLRSAGTWKDWAILTRTNAQIEYISSILTENGIPYNTFKQSDLTREALVQKMEENKVKILTSHASKGLQFKYCIVVGMKAFDEEERCLAYVSATRAEDGLLWMSAPKVKKATKPRYAPRKKKTQANDPNMLQW